MDGDKIIVNKEIVSEIFKMANLEVPTEINDENLLDAVFQLKTSMFNREIAPTSTEIPVAQEIPNVENPEPVKNPAPMSNNILVIDDIGVVTYQLKILFRNLGYNVEIARDIFSGINAFVKTNYAFVIMDLFVSTEQEGYTLLNETKKLITKNNLDTKIIVITASNKAENKVKCLNGGADIFLKKDTGWQDRLIEVIEQIHEKGHPI